MNFYGHFITPVLLAYTVSAVYRQGHLRGAPHTNVSSLFTINISLSVAIILVGSNIFQLLYWL